MQLLLFASSGLAQAGAWNDNAVTIQARCCNFISLLSLSRAPRLGYDKDSEPFARGSSMLFVAIGILLIALNLLGIGPFAAWNWNFFGDMWKFCVPFLLAVIWWMYSDKSGLDKRRQMDRMEKKKQNRRLENLASLGVNGRSRRKAEKQQR